jgi:hypothetical protein
MTIPSSPGEVSDRFFRPETHLPYIQSSLVCGGVMADFCRTDKVFRLNARTACQTITNSHRFSPIICNSVLPCFGCLAISASFKDTIIALVVT